jgi:hypothetical protein
MPRPHLPKGIAKTKVYQIRLSEKELNAIERIANNENITVATLFRRALKEWAINKRDNKQKNELPLTF